MIHTKNMRENTSSKERITKFIFLSMFKRKVFLLLLVTTRTADNISHFLTLFASPQVATKTLLANLQCTLFLANLQQFHHTAFIRRESHNFSDNILNETEATLGRRVPLGLSDVALGDNMPLLDPYCNSRHCFIQTTEIIMCCEKRKKKKREKHFEK
jgi:hypothetical protein